MSASASATLPKTPFTVWAFFVLTWLIGWWQVFDGLHQRLFGDYVRINGQLGPWAALVRWIGIDPQGFGWLFLVLGFAFIAASFGVYLRQRWGYQCGLVASAVSLLYLGFGTPIAALCLILLLLPPTRAHMAAPPPTPNR